LTPVEHLHRPRAVDASHLLVWNTHGEICEAVTVEVAGGERRAERVVPLRFFLDACDILVPEPVAGRRETGRAA
jgi:hypothetical protein